MADAENTSLGPAPGESAAAAGVLSGNALAPAAPAAPTGGLPVQPAPGNPEHARVGGLFHSVLGTLTGGQTEPSIDAEGKITDQPVHRTGGEWARRLLAGALTGMASGAEAPVRPGGAAAAGIGAGFAGEREALGREDSQKRAELQQNFKNQQAKNQQDQQAKTAESENTLRRAQTAYLTTQNTSLGFELSRNRAKASEDGIDAFNSFQKAVAAEPGNQDLGVFPDMNAVVAYHQDHPELVHQIAGGHDSGQIVTVPNLVQDEKGEWTYQGVRAALVHPSVNEKTVGEVFGDKPIPRIPYFVPGKMQADGKQAAGEWQTALPAPGTKYGAYLTTMQAASAAAAKENSVAAAASAAKNVAETGEAGARTNLIKEQTTQLLSTGQDELGRALPALPEKERTKRYDTFTKDYVKDLNQLEQANSQLHGILADAAKGKMTGADSVVGLFDAIGISSAPLKGRGFRINSSVTSEHTGARNIWQGMAANLSKLTPNGSGEVVTPKQLQDYSQILGRARHDLYVNMAREAERQGLPKDFMPKAPAQGAPVDVGTAKLYIDAYGGNVAVARQALAKFGWTIPQAGTGQ